MYKLLRRISGSFTSRLDRYWDDDATSNATQIGRKRRMSDDSHEETMGSTSKRTRAHNGDASPESPGETATPQPEDSPSTSASPATPGTPAPPAKETEEVRQVTKGVKAVVLEDKTDKETLAPDNAAEQNKDASGQSESSEGETKSAEETTVEDEPLVDASPEKTPSEPLQNDTAADDAISLDKTGECLQTESDTAASIDAQDTADPGASTHAAENVSDTEEPVTASASHETRAKTQE